MVEGGHPYLGFLALALSFSSSPFSSVVPLGFLVGLVVERIVEEEASGTVLLAPLAGYTLAGAATSSSCSATSVS